MIKGSFSNSITKSIFYLISVILIGYLIIKLKIIVGYLLIASILTLLSRPIVKFLCDKLKFRITLASIIAIILILIIIYLMS